MSREAQFGRLYEFYQELCRHLQIVVPFTGAASGRLDFAQWFEAVDRRCDLHQLRAFLLTSSISTEDLELVLKRFLSSHDRVSNQRKIDLLLVHYLARFAGTAHVSLSQAAHLLAPVLGATAPRRTDTLNEFERELESLICVRELLKKRILDRLAAERAQYAPDDPASLVVFAWLGLITRHACIRVFGCDLHIIENELQELRLHGITHVNCGFLGAQTVDEIERKCRQWRQPFSGKYRDDTWLEEIAAVRNAVMQANHRQKTEEAKCLAEPEEEVVLEDKEDPPVSLDTIVAKIEASIHDVRVEAIVRVPLPSCTLILTAAETEAFLFPDRLLSPILRQLVGARALLTTRDYGEADAGRARQIANEVLTEAGALLQGLQESGDIEVLSNLKASIARLQKVLDA